MQHSILHLSTSRIGVVVTHESRHCLVSPHIAFSLGNTKLANACVITIPNHKGQQTRFQVAQLTHYALIHVDMTSFSTS
jgi:hypothetical protein